MISNIFFKNGSPCISGRGESIPYVGEKNIIRQWPRYLTVVAICAMPVASYAQLNITDFDSGPNTAEDIVNLLLGPNSNATVSNISTTGDFRCLGVFSGGNNLGGTLGFDEGVMLSSGAVLDAVGPNMSDETTSEFFTPGDEFLNGLIPGGETFDACVIEFDFVCDGAQRVSVDYVMASEEYNEFVGEEASDVFGFALNDTNIATVPNSGGLPVSIANVNCGNPFDPTLPTSPLPPFCDLFINNDLQDSGGSIDIEADGLTTVLRAEGNLMSGVNHMKFAVGDVLDEAFDTRVFLKAGSFQCDVPSTPEQTLLLLTSRCTVWDANEYYKNEDIISFDKDTLQFNKVFDGSDVGLAHTNIDAFYQSDSGDIFFSISEDFYLNGYGWIRDEDILKFIPTSVGATTSGSFELYFDGSQNHMGHCGGDIDALQIDEGLVTGTDADNDGIPNTQDICPLDANNDIDGDGMCGNVKMYFSPTSSINIDGVWYADEDIVLFEEETGTFSKYFDGSDVGISHTDVDAIKLMDDQSILLSVKCPTFVQGFGEVGREDILRFTPTSIGVTTLGSFELHTDGSAIGINGDYLNFNGVDQITQ